MAWAWALWFGVALLLAVLEIISLDLVLIMFAGGAVAAAGLSLLGFDLWVQVLGFSVTAALLMWSLRPWLLRHLRDRVPLVETNVAAQVGRVAYVVTEVTERAGRVKLSGEVWTARTENDEVLDLGQEAQVVRIAGATAIVTAVQDGAVRDTPVPGTPASPHRPQETS